MSDYRPTNQPRNLHEALQYNDAGQAELRVSTELNVANATFTVSVDNFPAVQTVDGTIDVGNWPANQGVSLVDGASLSAFGRQRGASLKLLGEFRTFYGTTGNIEMINSTTGTASATANLTAKFVTLSVGTANGDRVIRQSRQYHPYLPGTGQLGLITFCFGEAKGNVQQSVGLYDDNDGIFLVMDGTTAKLVERKGGVNVTEVIQTSWNVDEFDGLGPSGVTLDWTKAQILVIDYEWLGVGRARVGFDVDGRIYYAHYFNHANSVTEPYNRQPSLPARWELRNVNNVPSPSSMRAICYSVYSEGGPDGTGFLNSASNNTTGVSISGSTGDSKGILAVRLKNTVNGVPVKALARIKEWEIVTTETIHYKVLLLPSSAFISGTPAWSTATPTGWCEYTTNFGINLAAGTDYFVLHQGYAIGGGGNKVDATSALIEERTAAIYQNISSTDSMIAAIVGYRMSNNATAYASLEWLEIK